MINLNRPNKESVLVLILGVACIVTAAVYGANAHADRLSALDAQTAHIDKVLGTPGNVSVCQYTEQFVALFTGSVEARQRAVLSYPVIENGMAGKRDENSAKRFAELDSKLKDLTKLHCQDIRTLVLDRQDEPVPIPSLP